ncbi:40-residue YVTN family beta-propeller repeat protein [Leptothrix cholodnii SP-6]|uniref:40-residue YVTN family beta-propeller repeat protein n=1 Tax=Leptothrix cholodnii (strain ATCC 51168 / LMG 8142 / SP-6) TaxID=395495 RepID=B1Y7D6_LEPCP|nr:40-residue YVTN family beta-propeller repeat protein [Leptothrix cholodnii SP-6]
MNQAKTAVRDISHASYQDTSKAVIVKTWLLKCLGVLALVAPGAHAGDVLPLVQQSVQAGVRAELSLSAEQAGLAPVGKPVKIALTLTDELSGTPLRGLRPRMWMSRQGADKAEPCKTQIRRFASGRLAQRADRDLNSFQLLTLNADASVSVINPLLQLNNTKLEALIPLPGVGTDWVHARGMDRLFVTLADRGELAVVDLGTQKLAKVIALGSGKPRRLAISPDESTVWVAMDDADRLISVDANTLERKADLPIGAGSHALVISDDGQRLAVTSSGADQVSVIDAREGRVIASVKVPGTPLPLTYSALSRRAYVGSLNAPSLTVIDLDDGRVVKRVDVPRPISALRADPSGRHVLGVNTAGSLLMAFDAASGSLVAQSQVVAQPDQIAFTQRFAFIRGLGSLSVQMVELRSLDEGRLALSELPVFQKLPNQMPEHVGPADLMAAGPEPGTMLLGSATDTALYYYTEGMMAPQGTYATYSRAARAVRVIDRSLKETAPGVYTGSIKLDRGGRYSLPLLLEQPRLAHCYALAIDETGTTADGRRLNVAYQWPEAADIRTGRDWELQIRLTDAQSGAAVTGVRDLQLMVLERPGLSQQRQFAQEREPGVYVVRQRFPRPGVWRLMVQSVSQRLSFDRSPLLDQAVRTADIPSDTSAATNAPR